MKILILGPGCTRCRTVYARTLQAVKELGIDSSVEKIEDMQQIVAWDVASLPAVVIDGVVKGSGQLFTVEQIKAFLKV